MRCLTSITVSDWRRQTQSRAQWGWCVFESPGVEPVFLQKDQTIGYAETRARLRTGEIRIFDSTGKVQPLEVSNTAQLRDLAASAARVFGWDKGGTTVHADKALVVTTKQLQQMRELCDAG